MTFGLAWFLSLAVLLTPPAWEGDSTWYSLPGRTMRDGTVMRDDAPICAVDSDMFDRYVGKTWLVCTRWKCAPCVVRDSGYLRQADVLVDVSPALFKLLFGKLGVGRGKVQVWRIE